MQLLIILLIALSSFRLFDLGIAASIGLGLANFCGALIYLNITKAVIRPVDDPGISIWWLCCVKFGRTGKFKNGRSKAKKNKKASDKDANKRRSQLQQREVP